MEVKERLDMMEMNKASLMKDREKANKKNTTDESPSLTIWG